MTPPAIAAPEAPPSARQADDSDVDTGTLGGERKRPVAWGGWLGWHDLVLAAVFYTIAGHGISIGFHRYFTHKSFKPNRPLKYALAIAGSLAIEGPVVRWVADHRKHHKFSDRDGDPHSPWKYGTSVA